ncbi:M23 family metallopeptidase [Angustibacter aerolatus]
MPLVTALAPTPLAAPLLAVACLTAPAVVPAPPPTTMRTSEVAPSSRTDPAPDLASRPTAGADLPLAPVGRARTAPASGWRWPLEPPTVLAPFHPPPTPWGAGHRGVDLAATVGQVVRSPAAGVVAFSGVVAGRGVLVVRTAAGLQAGLEPLSERLPTGTPVRAGERVGVVAAGPGHCLPATCVHWGVRRAGVYIDPLQLVRAGPPVLLPLATPGAVGPVSRP